MLWRAWQDLNLRHLAPEASALSTELQAPSFAITVQGKTEPQRLSDYATLIRPTAWSDASIFE